MNDSTSPAFFIGDIPIFGRRILAPMDGLSDLPFRTLCRTFGSAISYTPFVSASAVIGDSTRALAALAHAPGERPLAFQVFDDDEDRLLHASLRLAELGPDFIDVNMGCSVRCVAGRGAGAGLLREPARVARIIRSLSRALAIPVTAKIRLGWDDASRNYLTIARIIEDNGGRLIAVHGRTRAQGYTGTADWDPIGEIKASVSIPVIGNGDVRSGADADRLLRLTGCDAVMIGRGAIGNPWIFHPDLPIAPGPMKVLEVIRTHLTSMLDHYGEGEGVILFRKHLARYLDHLDPSLEARRAMLTEAEAGSLIRHLTDLVRPHGTLHESHLAVSRPPDLQPTAPPLTL